MEWYIYPLVVGAGIMAGFINTVAGSGSLVTLPILIFAGLPANIANGTNRIGVLFQNIVAVNSFHKEKALDVKGSIYLSIPAAFGSLLGAQIAVNLNETLMRQVIGVIMLLMLVVIIIQPKKWLKGERQAFEGRPSAIQLIVFFIIGVYGGFIQAGVGIFLLAGLVLSAGYDLVRANAVKVAIVLIFTIFALFVFFKNGQVNLLLGFVLAIGNMLGAWIGAKFAVHGGAVWVRRLLIAIIVVSALNLLGLIDKFVALFAQ